jgi:hypothetical protein
MVLESFCCLESPAGGWKLVVVDNGSTDETGRVLSSFKDRLPLQSVVEPELGKNIALNTGLKLVEGDLTVLTDDDVFPSKDWLVQLRNAADDHPAHSVFGGVVVPRWEVPPPNWTEWVDLSSTFAITPPFAVEGELTGYFIGLVFGPNMVVRTCVFNSGIRFNPSIGPRGASYAMGGETEFLLRLQHEGHKAWHVHAAVVEHFIRKEQLNKDWVLQRAIRFGRGSERLRPSTQRLGGIPRNLLGEIPLEILRIMMACATLNQENSFRARLRLNHLLGVAREGRMMARERRTAQC